MCILFLVFWSENSATRGVYQKRRNEDCCDLRTLYHFYAQVGAPLKFYYKVFILLSFSQCQKIPQRIRIGLGNHIFTNWKQKIHSQKIFFRKRLIVPKKILSAQGTTLSQAESLYKSGWYSLTK